MNRIRPYEGDEPYIFISYAHANSPAVMEVVEELHDRGYRIWYDDGIEVGSEWPEYIAQHLLKASLVIAFLSNAYIRSPNCRKEMHYALSKRINTINIFLEETSMTPGMEMQIGNLFALMKFCMSDSVFYEKLYDAPQLNTALLADGGAAVPAKKAPRKKKKAPVDLTAEAKKTKKRRLRRGILIGLLLALLLAAVILGIVFHSTGLAQRLQIRKDQSELVHLPGDTAAVFQSSLLEQAARDYAGLPEGELHVSDLIGLKELAVCGDSCFFSASDLPETAEAAGSLQNLSDLKYFPDLITLHLKSQKLSSLESLPVCGIEYLELSDCRLTSLKGIGNLVNLRELSVDNCPVRELADLSLCLQLRSLSLLETSVADFSAVKPLTELAEISLSHCGINELGTVMGLSSLTDVAFYDCDLRGSFFRAFDRERSIVTLTLVDCKLNSTGNLTDFSGLTTLTLVRSGEALDWSALADLPVLQTVKVDKTMEASIRTVLKETEVSVILT
ncbi:MAG: TIR domain-containing protein [Oscillospiraceae bacterium]|nr:TIR domain-containing protein [Oscillospiraceae bacterium]